MAKRSRWKRQASYSRGSSNCQRGSADELDDQLRNLADTDALALESSYALTRFITWAIPIIGFLGTVLGITGAISGVTPEVLEKSLSTVTDGLALAFDTTALALGLTMLTTLLRDARDVTFYYLALIALLFGDILLAIFIAFHLGIASVGVQETVRTRVVPDYYVQLILWTQPLFVIYTILAFLALAAYGETFLPTRVLPHWMGRLSIVYGLAGLVFAGFAAGNAPPFLHYLMPIVMGILLLLQRPQRAIGRHHEEAVTYCRAFGCYRRETMSMKRTSPLEQ